MRLFYNVAEMLRRYMPCFVVGRCRGDIQRNAMRMREARGTRTPLVVIVSRGRRERQTARLSLRHATRRHTTEVAARQQ